MLIDLPKPKFGNSNDFEMPKPWSPRATNKKISNLLRSNTAVEAIRSSRVQVSIGIGYSDIDDNNMMMTI